MKPLSVERQESQSAAFDTALAERDEQEAMEEVGGTDVDPLVIEPVTDDFDVVVGEPEPEPEETKPDGTGEAISKLVDVLADRLAPAPVEIEVPARPGIEAVDVEAVKKEFNEKLHESEDPFSVAIGATEKVFGPTIARQAREIQELKKETLKSDPDKKFILENHGKEVEKVVAELPAAQQNHPDIYVYAVNQVMMSHMDDIVERRVNARLEEGKPKIAVTTRPGATNSLGGGGTGGGSSKPKKKKYYASKTDEAMARKFGMSLKNYLVSQGKI